MSRLFAASEPATKSRLFSQESPSAEQPSKGFLGNLMDYEKSLGIGLAQGGGDVLASIGNFPADIYKHFTGTEPYHIPHPSLQQYYPEGTVGDIGSKVGETIGNVAGPGGIAFKALRAFNNPLAKALMGGAAGGIANAASNENDRLGAGITGAALGSAGPLASTIMRGLGNVTPLTKGIAFSPYIKKAEYMQKHGLGSDLYVKPQYLHEAKRLMETMGVPEEAIEQSLPKAHAGEHDAIHAVQSTLKSLGRELSSKGGVEGKLGEKFHGLAEKIMGDVNDQMKIMGHGKAVQLENQGKKRTARYYKQAPLRKLAAKTGVGALGLGSGYEALKHILR